MKQKGGGGGGRLKYGSASSASKTFTVLRDTQYWRPGEFPAGVGGGGRFYLSRY